MPKLINVGGEPLLKEKSWCFIQEREKTKQVIQQAPYEAVAVVN